MSARLFRWMFLSGIILAPFAAGADGGSRVERMLNVAPVWAGHPVGFCLLTHPPNQYVAYYDAERRMTVAQRKLDSEQWTFTVLPETVGWDSHNYITMTLDRDEYLHLSGNLHVHPLKYFRSEQPLDAATLVRVPQMVGSEEDRVTYPDFLTGPNQELIFTYRDGKSGAGNQIYNVYDLESRAWRRLLDKPLTDGQGKMNAYFNGPVRGPDGYFHLCWVWRDHGGCESNHDLSYARSKDLIHWENSRGAPFSLPITLETAEIVDPVPVGGGIINGNTKLGFDGENRPVIAYHKYDANGHTQLYNARLEEGRWQVHLSSDWKYRWAFSGGGAIHFEIRVEPVKTNASGTLTQGWSHDQYGHQTWRLDPETLHPVERIENPGNADSVISRQAKSEFPGMQVNVRADSGSSEQPGVRYCLRWETLGSHRDKPRDPPWPAPSMLRLYRVRSAD